MWSGKSVLQTVAFFKMHHEPVFLKSEPGYGIVSVSSPGPAPQNPSCCHYQPRCRAMHPESIKCILRTRGHMPARRSQKRRYGIPVKVNGKGKNPNSCRFQNPGHGAKIDKRRKTQDARRKVSGVRDEGLGVRKRSCRLCTS